MDILSLLLYVVYQYILFASDERKVVKTCKSPSLGFIGICKLKYAQQQKHS